jgi:hypothetical protein
VGHVLAKVFRVCRETWVGEVVIEEVKMKNPQLAQKTEYQGKLGEKALVHLGLGVEVVDVIENGEYGV